MQFSHGKTAKVHFACMDDASRAICVGSARSIHRLRVSTTSKQLNPTYKFFSTCIACQLYPKFERKRKFMRFADECSGYNA